MADFKPLTKNKKTVPVCPNHNEPLEGLPRPLTPKGVGMCPISGCSFDYEITVETGEVEYIKDHNGNLTPIPQFKVIGDEK